MLCYNPTCEIETTNPKFCSRRCSAIITNKQYHKNVSKWVCEKCGISNNRSSKRSKLCAGCKGKIDTDFLLKDVRRRYAHTRERHNLINTRARQLLRNLNRIRCEWKNCDWSYSFQAAHKKPSSSFSDDTKISEINSPDNLMALCPNHHWLFDHPPIVQPG